MVGRIKLDSFGSIGSFGQIVSTIDCNGFNQFQCVNRLRPHVASDMQLLHNKYFAYCK